MELQNNKTTEERLEWLEEQVEILWDMYQYEKIEREFFEGRFARLKEDVRDRIKDEIEEDLEHYIVQRNIDESISRKRK